MNELRKILLQLDRTHTRKKAQRKLMRLMKSSDSEISSLSYTGLAESFFLDGNFSESIKLCKEAMVMFPKSSAGLFCVNLLIGMYEQLGMKQEAFEAKSKKRVILGKERFQEKVRLIRRKEHRSNPNSFLALPLVKKKKLLAEPEEKPSN